jgi:hypothetical protein
MRYAEEQHMHVVDVFLQPLVRVWLRAVLQFDWHDIFCFAQLLVLVGLLIVLQ